MDASGIPLFKRKRFYYLLEKVLFSSRHLRVRNNNKLRPVSQLVEALLMTYFRLLRSGALCLWARLNSKSFGEEVTFDRVFVAEIRRKWP